MPHPAPHCILRRIVGTVAGLYEIRARNFPTLKDVSVPLGRLTVLVGPNAAGKSNPIDVVGFLRDAARSDLARALGVRGGFGRVHFRGDSSLGCHYSSAAK